MLISPALTEGANTILNVEMYIKNTIVARIKSDRELKARVYFVTDKNDGFALRRSKIFTIPEGENTVYFNFSDLKSCKGRLISFAFQPLEGEGKLIFKKFSFEREERIFRPAGEVLSCIADKKKVKIKGRVKGGCRKISVYAVFPHIIHYNEEELEKLAEVDEKDIKGNKFEVSFPLMKKKTSRLSTQFLLIAEKKNGKAAEFNKRAVIENWEDFTDNPYKFQVPKKSYYVTDMGARGDGYTDDTKAIQRTIDEAAKEGGGIVILSGDDTRYGRRYLISNIRLKSNIELRIEKGAVLWQSDDMDHYDRLPRFGHNVAMSGVNWAANHSSGNFPLIYAHQEKNVKITGEGKIRLCDTGSISEDGHFRFIGDNVCVGCCDRMHVCPVGFSEVENVEITNISIIRSSAVHIIIWCTRKSFIGNVFIDECKCTGADGIWPGSSRDVKITRCIININDDGIAMGAGYNDPRHILWYFNHPGTDQSIRNLEVSHNYIYTFYFTGRAISYCTWGTTAPDLSTAEIRGLNIFDNILQGNCSVGCYGDNPYYGKQPYDMSETDDFSPVVDGRILNNEYWSQCNIFPIRPTNYVTDCGIVSASNFEYGSFTRRPQEQNEGWVTGLSNWSYADREAVSVQSDGERNYGILRASEGKYCSLYQGLYIDEGERAFSAEIKSEGEVRMFVKTAEGKLLAERRVKADKFTTFTLDFELKKATTLEIGIDNYNCDMTEAFMTKAAIIRK